MEFGITLFPDVGPEEKVPQEYYRESFDIVERAEELGYTHVRSIEHHLTGYGYNPLQMAGELGMVDAMSNGFAKFNIDTLINSCAAWVGSPAEVCDQIERYSEACGGFGFASMQVNFHTLLMEEALRSIELFAEEVMPRFRTLRVLA